VFNVEQLGSESVAHDLSVEYLGFPYEDQAPIAPTPLDCSWIASCSVPEIHPIEGNVKMQTVPKTLLSAAAGIASTRLAHLMSDLDLNVLIRPLGLTQRRSSWPQNLAFLGAGIVAGGVAALLLAPSSGRETRARFATRARELSDAASKQGREIGEQVREEIDAPEPSADDNQPAIQTEA
jgi:hypothetical protein